MTDQSTKCRRGLTCEVSSFEVEEFPGNEGPERVWMAVASAHVYDPGVSAPPLTPMQAVATGAVLRTISATARSSTEASAMMAAVKGLMYELTALGFSQNFELKTGAR